MVMSTYGRAFRILGKDMRTAVLLGLASLLSASLQFLDPILFGKVIGLLSGSTSVDGNPGDWIRVMGLWGISGIFSIVVGLLISLISDRMANRNKLRVMGEFYSHSLELSHAFHGSNHSGRLMKTMWSGLDACFWLWLTLFREHLSGVVALIVLLPLTLFMNPILGTVLILLVIINAVVTAWVVTRTEHLQRKTETYHGDLASAVQDAISNVAVVQAFTRAVDERRRFSEFAAKVASHQMPVLNWWAAVSVLTRSFSTIAMLVIVVLGGVLHSHHQADVGDIVSFMGFAGIVIGRMESMVFFVARLFAAKPQLDDFFKVLDTPSTAERKNPVHMTACTGHVRFDGVGFSYPSGGKVLDSVSFEATPGMCVALVGGTGAGKSTAMSLLQRNWDATEGSISIDGHDVRDIALTSLKEAIGVVFQDNLLFNRTIRENLLIGKPDATHDEVEAACRKAEAHEFIMRQTSGYDTMVGERGTTLSGGQKQRLAIARALLKNPPILILDEATSALDAATEAKVSKALSKLMEGRTTFIIAHRLSTVRNADEILVFDEGKVVERGDFGNLVQRKGRFSELVESQLMPSPPPTLFLVA